MEFRANILPFECGTNRFCVALLILFVILILFGAMSAMFDFSEQGFYSIYGASEFLGIIVFVSYCFITFWLWWIATKLDELQDIEQSYQPIYSVQDDKQTDNTL